MRVTQLYSCSVKCCMFPLLESISTEYLTVIIFFQTSENFCGLMTKEDTYVSLNSFKKNGNIDYFISFGCLITIWS